MERFRNCNAGIIYVGNKMTFEEVNEKLSPGGDIISIMSNDERKYIWDLVIRVKEKFGVPPRVIEIGSSHGGTTILMQKAGAIVYSVDNWECGQREVFKANTAKMDSDKGIIEFEGDSRDLHTKFDNSFFDLVLIDGGHFDPIPYLDLVNYAPKVKQGGYLLIDDISNSHPDGTIGLIKWFSDKWGARFIIDKYFPFEEASYKFIKLLGMRRIT